MHNLKQEEKMEGKRLQLLLLLFGLLLSSCSGGSSAVGDDAVPLVGHWSWYQLTVIHPDNPMHQISPSVCIGDADVTADGIFKIWNVCKQANNKEKVEAVAQGTWHRISQNTYKACYSQCYDVFLDKTGTLAMFASTSTEDQPNTGLYEYGHMFKDVFFDHKTVGGK